MTDERVCKDCSKSISHMGPRALRCPDCARHAKTKQRKGAHYSESISSVDQGGHRVRRDGSPVKDKELPCSECYGLSWRRTGWCVGCKQWYAPEPHPERLGALASSMGTLVSEGRLYGYSGIGGGHHAKNKSGRI